MSLVALIIAGLLLVQDFILLVILYVNFKDYSKHPMRDYPMVSVLIPARNEAGNLPDCLESLEKLDYPEGRIQFVLGDDDSTDQTLEILENWAVHRSDVCIVKIKMAQDFEGKINGKARALAQMARQATGEFLLFTDADCIVPENWVSEMVGAVQSKEVGFVTGITTIKERQLFGKCQSMDWWLTLGMVKVLDDLGVSVTSMGNNMLIATEAYRKVGGFEGIPNSLTEDLELGRALRKAGYLGRHQVSADNLVLTKAQCSVGGLMEQRKRWLSGAMTLPVFWKILLGVQVLFFPAMLYLMAVNSLLASIGWIFKILLQGAFIKRFAAYSKQQLNWHDLFVFEIYYLIVSWSTIVYYFWPAKTYWKGRKY